MKDEYINYGTAAFIGMTIGLVVSPIVIFLVIFYLWTFEWFVCYLKRRIQKYGFSFDGL